MNETNTLSLQLAKQLVSRPPKTNEQKDALRRSLQQLERLTAAGVEHFTKHWSEWNLGCELPLNGVEELDTASLQALFASGCFFSLGLTRLDVEQATLLASMTTTCRVFTCVELCQLKELPYEIAEMLVLKGQSSYTISGDAEIDERTLALLLSPRNERVVISHLSVSLACCLSNLPAECSLEMIRYNFTSDEVSGHIADSVPWFQTDDNSKHFYAPTMSDCEGNRRLLRRIGATIPRLNFNVPNHFHPEALKAILGPDSLVKELNVRLSKVSRELAEALLVIEHKPEKLEIDVAEALSNEVAGTLAKYEGALRLKVREISVSVAEILIAANKIDPDWVFGSARKNVNIAVKNLKGLKFTTTTQISEGEIAEFEKMRKTISEILPLDRPAKKNRFVSRLRKSKSEISQILSEVKEMCDDDDAALISEFLKHPPSWDRNLSIKLTESSDPVDFENFGESLIDCGCYAAFGAYSSEDHLYEFTATGGQTWIDQLFAELAKEKPKSGKKWNWDISRHICYTESDSAEIVICEGQVRILACGPESGSKWINYEVIPREICDFLNVILFSRGYLAMYIEVEEYWGFFAIFSREDILDVLGKMKKCFESRKQQSDAADQTKQRKSARRSALDCRGKQEKLRRSKPSNLVENENKLRNSKARTKPAKKKARK